MTPFVDFERPVLRLRDLPPADAIPVPPGASPECYGQAIAGHCLGSGMPEQAIAIVDPDQHPEPGDLVVCWFRERDGVVMLISPDRTEVLQVREEWLHSDEHMRELVERWGWSVDRSPFRSYGKVLRSRVPPVEAWADDHDHSLVVEQLKPAFQFRTSLSGVLAVDRVVSLVPIAKVLFG